MGLYIYENPKNGEIKEIFQSMSEEHKYSENGIKWNRVWTVPLANSDTMHDEDNLNQFVERTKNKRGDLGNVQDYAKELSLKREKIRGIDPVKTEFYDKYSKKTGGKKCHSQIVEESNKRVVEI